MAAGSFDDILAITGFSTCLGIAFSTGETLSCPPQPPWTLPLMRACCAAGSTWMTVLQGLLEVVGGVISGLVVGFFLCLFPSNDQVGRLAVVVSLLPPMTSHV